MPPAAPDDADLRDRTHLQLAQFLGPGGELERLPDDARDSAPGLFSLTTLRDLGRMYLADQPAAEPGGALAIVTAGPPGAGKTTRAAALDGYTGYRRIDADEIKDLLLSYLDAAAVIPNLDGYQMLDGISIRRRELGRWVHHQSTTIQDGLIADAMARRENVLIEGTLGWDGLIETYAGRMEQNEYERLDIVDVEVTMDDAIENARQRWWEARHEDPLGGRFMLDEDFARFFPHGRARSTCADNAEALFARTIETIHQVRLERTDRDADGERTQEWVSVDGIVRVEG